MTISHKMTADIIVHSCHGTKRTFIMYFRRYERGLLSYEMLDYKSTRKMYLKKNRPKQIPRQFSDMLTQ